MRGVEERKRWPWLGNSPVSELVSTAGPASTHTHLDRRTQREGLCVAFSRPGFQGQLQHSPLVPIWAHYPPSLKRSFSKRVLGCPRLTPSLGRRKGATFWTRAATDHVTEVARLLPRGCCRGPGRVPPVPPVPGSRSPPLGVQLGSGTAGESAEGFRAGGGPSGARGSWGLRAVVPRPLPLVAGKAPSTRARDPTHVSPSAWGLGLPRPVPRRPRARSKRPRRAGAPNSCVSPRARAAAPPRFPAVSTVALAANEFGVTRDPPVATIPDPYTSGQWAFSEERGQPLPTTVWAAGCYSM